MKTWITFLAICMFVACTKKSFNRPSGSGRVDPSASADQTPGDGSIQAGTEAQNMLLNSALIWKRYRAFEQGLMAGLELGKNELCQEAGQFPCVDQVHLTVLGGNEPYDNAQYERAERPSVLTAVAVDRVLLTACSRRVALDKAAGIASANVFKHFSLSNQAVNAEQASTQVVDLYRRLLARDPNQQELAMAAAFAAEIPEGEKLAVALCFAIGSTAENVFL